MLALVERMAAQGAVTRQGCPGGDRHSRRPGKPRQFVFSFKPPTKTFQLRMSFKKGRVDKAEIIEALENIIRELRARQIRRAVVTGRGRHG